MKAIITVGIPCSGKTTFAEAKCRKDNSWVNANRDDLRWSLTGAKTWKEYKFNKHTENMISCLQEAIATKAASVGKNVIISDTNLNPKTLEKWKRTLSQLGFSVEVKEFDISYEEALKGDTLRANGVGQKVIYEMYQKWLKYKGQQVYSPNKSKPLAAIFDIDGTLADMGNMRSPFEWDKVYLDKVRVEVKELLDSYASRNYRIIILSGRDGVCEDLTRKWLADKDINYDAFFMRRAGDSRKDSIIKEELFFQHVADNYNVQVVVDDRPQMIRKWYELGIPLVLSVADPYVEF